MSLKIFQSFLQKTTTTTQRNKSGVSPIITTPGWDTSHQIPHTHNKTAAATEKPHNGRGIWMQEPFQHKKVNKAKLSKSCCVVTFFFFLLNVKFCKQQTIKEIWGSVFSSFSPLPCPHQICSHIYIKHHLLVYTSWFPSTAARLAISMVIEDCKGLLCKRTLQAATAIPPGGSYLYVHGSLVALISVPSSHSGSCLGGKGGMHFKNETFHWIVKVCSRGLVVPINFSNHKPQKPEKVHLAF